MFVLSSSVVGGVGKDHSIIIPPEAQLQEAVVGDRGERERDERERKKRRNIRLIRSIFAHNKEISDVYLHKNESRGSSKFIACHT